jgi:hypothetical protein
MTTKNDSAANLKRMLLCPCADHFYTGLSEPSPRALAGCLLVNYDKEQPR